MKKYIIGMIIVLIGAVIVWFFMFKNKNIPQAVIKQDANNQVNTNQPKNSPTAPKQNTPVVIDPVVANDFKGQIANSNTITLYKTTIADNYALQEWGDENKGGEALLKYQTTGGWFLLSFGGGAWDLSSLIDIGVPKLTAEKLLMARGTQ